MGLQQMATPRAGDNRVAAQMDGRHVHNAVAALQRWMGAGKHAVIWQRNLLLGLLGSGSTRFQGLRPSARHGSRLRADGLRVGINNSRNKIIVTFSFGNGK